jgi:hypothetical protein
MTADWRLQQALSALHSGASAMQAEDPDAPLELGALTEEMADVEAACRALVRHTQDAQDLADAARKRAAEATERARRYEARAARYKGLVLAAMDAVGWRKREWPEATVSLRAPQAAVVITDETVLPERFIRVTRTPDKEALRAALKDGEVIDGAALANGSPSLQLRSN